MPKAKSAYFTERFPKLCPADPKSEFQYFGGMACVLEGWFHRLVKLCEDLEALNVPVELTQVKQKFGNLRAHFDTADEHYALVQAVIGPSQEECSYMCAACGAQVPDDRRDRVHGMPTILYWRRI